jgi:uncharacterized membrane protein
MLSVFLSRFETFTLRHWLCISCIFSCLLAAVRVIATGHLTFLFLVWNLFLAIVPYALSEGFSHRADFHRNKYRAGLLLFVWLLFIPNTFYIITDLFHLDTFNTAPKWFDLLLIFSFAWNGLLLGILSIRSIELILQKLTPRKLSLFYLLTVMFLNAFGIYIGRYLRFNSWDILAQPSALLRAIGEVVFHPLHNFSEWVMISVYAVFMTLLYITIQKTSEHFHQTKHL